MCGVFRALLIAVVAVSSVVPVSAGPLDGELRARGEAVLTPVRNDRRGGGRGEAQRFLPLEVVLGNVARTFPGHHLSVEGPFQRDGRWVYRIKWLTPDGRVLIVFADAESGQVLGSRGGS
jgi:Peptidase propeptide and YPEB domain